MSRTARYVLVGCLLLLCNSGASARVTVGVFGDMPYNAAEEPELISIIAEMNRQPLAFAMHVGDFKSAQSECSDAVFQQRRESFDLSHHPFVFVPGDNEWTDCGRAYWAKRDPLERLAKLRALFFPADTTLGQRTLALERQTKRGYPEHLRWIIDNIVFVTLNMPGPANNSGMPNESRPRTAALLDWTREGFRIAREHKSPGIVLALQANIWSGNNAYDEILDALRTEASRFAGEVLVVHGDTHRYRFDQPLVDGRGVKVRNVTRLEVFGSPFVDWVHVTIDVENGRAKFTVQPGSERARGTSSGASGER